MPDLKSFYPAIEPYETGFLDVGDGHRLYWEQSGNADGIAITFLHGGPGSGCTPWQRQLFNPEKYRIILFDQRGAGKSKPHASLENNTTQDLINDIEKIRNHFALENWHVSGGSWGATLALAYADQHAEHINSLTMYGIFLCREEELKSLYFDNGVASKVFPEIFEEYLNFLPKDKRDNPLTGYRDLFKSEDEATRHKAIDLWTRLEKRVAALVVTKEALNQEMADPDFVLAHSLIENHYFIHNGFIDGDEILKNISSKLKDKAVHIVQGRYDMVCPFKTAWDLHQALPNSKLHVIYDAGHTAKEPKTTSKLIDIFDNL